MGDKNLNQVVTHSSAQPGQELQNHGQEFNHGQEILEVSSPPMSQIPPQSPPLSQTPLQYPQPPQNIYIVQPQIPAQTVPYRYTGKIDHNVAPERRGLTTITSLEQLWSMSCCIGTRPTCKFWMSIGFLIFVVGIICILYLILTRNYGSDYNYNNYNDGRYCSGRYSNCR